uniref:Uncharacterized protein n=1 Tax=Nelumbo nucifera TaxID=4432 RepID=A0A822ZGD1_NELNU|nr:TPA_asm: hypothetical protein HUJ06_000961 [Nelumbo nucifera]
MIGKRRETYLQFGAGLNWFGLFVSVSRFVFLWGDCSSSDLYASFF